MNSNEQLDRDALLLAYAAEELPLAQKTAFEAQLANDVGLAAELTRVRQAMEFAAASLLQLDQTQRAPVQDAVAVRRASRSIGQWTIDRLRPKEVTPSQPWAMPWWIYPSAAAAVVIVSFLIWSGRQAVPDKIAAPMDSNIAMSTEMDNAEKESLANSLEKQFEPPTEVAVDDSSRTSAATDSEDSGVFFINPQEETFR